jgi:hypothetical protein
MKINKFKKRAVLSILMSMLCLISLAQEKMISGKVTDSSDTPMIGVTVVVSGTTTGTVTDASGNYSLKVRRKAL